eukprot:m.541867 g.541867  ORF g.541867 m.541867 type:complete len:521 (-) comp22113_c1_seq6:1378-2940(-)
MAQNVDSPIAPEVEMAQPRAVATFEKIDFSTMWSTLGYGDIVKEDICEQTSTMETLPTFASRVDQLLPAWVDLFKAVPSGSKWRKDALGGAIKIKTASKILAEISKDQVDGAKTAHVAEVSDTDGGASGAEVECSSGAQSPQDPVTKQLSECQSAFRDSVLGLLEVSFPVDESITAQDFKDADAAADAMDRLKTAQDMVQSLRLIFKAADVDPRATSADAIQSAKQNLPPEVLQMLEKAMADKKGNVAPEEAEHVKAAKKQWEQTADGQCSGVLGDEVWEALCWRRGIFLFSFVVHLLDNISKSTATADDRDTVRAHIDKAICCFHLMLHAQGPIGSDNDELSEWRPATDGRHSDETARLFHHGIYSSTHLRGLKHQAELAYWRWKHFRDDATVDARRLEQSAEFAALLNRKFTHIVRHIMPGAGWTADVEYERVLELEKDGLQGRTTMYSALLDVPAPQMVQAMAQQKKKALQEAKAKGKEGSGGGDADDSANGGDASSTGDQTARGTPKKKRSPKKKK